MAKQHFRNSDLAKARVIENVKNFTFFLKEKGINFNKAYLFGSYAKGLNQRDSDIDLAFVFSDLKDKFKIQVDMMNLRRVKDIDIEPHPLEEKDFNISNPLASEIIKNGIRIL